MPRTATIPILTYHAITVGDVQSCDEEALFYAVSQEEFARQMSVLSQNGFYSSLIDELDRLSFRAENQVAITFDDGLESDVSAALPVLRDYRLRATFFVVVDQIGKSGYASWSDLETLLAAGHSVQCHGFTHQDLTQIGGDDLYGQLTTARMELERQLRISVSCLSLPFGLGNKEVVAVARRAGFKTILTSEQRVASVDAEVLSRIVVHSRTSLNQFRAIVRREPRTLLSLRLRQLSLETIKRLVGPARYAELKRCTRLARNATPSVENAPEKTATLARESR